MTHRDRSDKLGIGPSKKDMQDAVNDAIKGLSKWFSDTIVHPITTFFSNLMKGTEKLWAETSKSVVHAETSVAHTVATLEMVVNDYESWATHRAAAFRGELTTFFSGLTRLAEEIPKKAEGLDFDIDKSLQPIIAAYVAQIPGVPLYGLDKALGGNTNWSAKPGQLADWVDQHIPQLAGDPAIVCPSVLDPNNPKPWQINQMLMIATDLKNLVSVAKEILPTDLSITAVAVAGGGTEVSSHPTKWPFIFAVHVLHMAEILLKRYVDVYGSCSNGAWKANVDAQLKELIDRSAARN
jgi:hypothetical protein